MFDCWFCANAPWSRIWSCEPAPACDTCSGIGVRSGGRLASASSASSRAIRTAALRAAASSRSIAATAGAAAARRADAERASVSRIARCRVASGAFSSRRSSFSVGNVNASFASS